MTLKQIAELNEQGTQLYQNIEKLERCLERIQTCNAKGFYLEVHFHDAGRIILDQSDMVAAGWSPRKVFEAVIEKALNEYDRELDNFLSNTSINLKQPLENAIADLIAAHKQINKETEDEQAAQQG